MNAGRQNAEEITIWLVEHCRLNGNACTLTHRQESGGSGIYVQPTERESKAGRIKEKDREGEGCEEALPCAE